MTLQSNTFTITKEEENKRLDVLLTEKYQDYSRSYIQYLFKEKKVFCNKSTIKKHSICKQGDLIELNFIPLKEIKLDPEDIPLDILFEDGDIIICNKPAGMVTHPAPGSYSNTFAGALLFYLKSLPESDDPLRPGIVHRLDKKTSGIIIGAKTAKALTAFQEMFAERKIEKTYLAICHGYIKDQHVNARIGRHPVLRKKMAIVNNGKEASTEFKLLNKDKGFCLVEAKPYTGRTHQIRVHAKHLKCPIVGDDLYGPKSSNTSRHLLHAYKIKFIHPFSGEQIEVEAKVPEDFETFFSNL
jgi:23S rRNA pseudouridine1911/1915/1917 synthase